MQALILAGGRGMRLAPLTHEVPVPLLYLPNGTLLDYTLHTLSSLPIEQTALLLQYRGDQVARYLNRHSSPSPYRFIPQYPPFTYVGALASAAPWVEGPTLVLHSNLYLANLLEDFLAEANPQRPTFLWDAEREELLGAYLLPPEAFYIAARHLTGNDIQALWDLLEANDLAPTYIPVEQPTFAVQTPDDLLALNRYLLLHWHDTPHPPETQACYDALNFNWIAPDAEVGEDVNALVTTIGPGVRVQRGRLHNALLMPGVQLDQINESDAILATSPDGLLHVYGPLLDYYVAA